MDLEDRVPDLTRGLLKTRESDDVYDISHDDAYESPTSSSSKKDRGFSLQNFRSEDAESLDVHKDFDTAMLFVSASIKGRSHKIRVDTAFSVR